jgi:hypothetical protein
MNKNSHVFYVCQRFFSGVSTLVLLVLFNVTVIFTARGAAFNPFNSNADVVECSASQLRDFILEGGVCKDLNEVVVVSASVRHETVKRGAHASEMEPGEYVIASGFKSPDNAKHFASGLRNLEFNARYGYLSEKDLWFVYILKTSDPKKARMEHARVSAMFLLRDAWLITVQP